jgi:hypothetical protein
MRSLCVIDGLSCQHRYGGHRRTAHADSIKGWRLQVGNEKDLVAPSPARRRSRQRRGHAPAYPRPRAALWRCEDWPWRADICRIYVLPVNRSMASMTAFVELAITRETMLGSTPICGPSIGRMTTSLRCSCHPSLMPNSKPGQNAKSLSNAQLFQTSTPKNRPLDSTKTPERERDDRRRPSAGVSGLGDEPAVLTATWDPIKLKLAVRFSTTESGGRRKKSLT